MKTFAAGFKDFLAVFGDIFLMAVPPPLGTELAGAGSANPNAGLSLSTDTDCSLDPTFKMKNFSSFLITRNGPSYGRCHCYRGKASSFRKAQLYNIKKIRHKKSLNASINL